jgi:peptidylprolyl isomerase
MLIKSKPLCYRAGKTLTRNFMLMIIARLFTLLLLLAVAPLYAAETPRSPYHIVEQAPPADWRELDASNTVYIELEKGTVVVELFPEIAPAQSANFKTLVQEGFYDGLSIYRVVEGFVAQGGDADNEREPRQGKRALPGEFEYRGILPYEFVSIDKADSFADQSGFMHGFPMGREGRVQWLLHCPGAFALARDNAPDSGGTEFYAVLGHAPRYLDRNVTVFGMVRQGMEVLQKLNRGADSSGQLPPERRNPIRRMRMAADIAPEERLPLQVMRTYSASFSELVRSRANRPEPWFVARPGYVDVCGVPAPVRHSP